VSVDRAGNNRSKAKSIGLIAGSKSLVDGIGSADKYDFYRFTLNKSSNFTLSLKKLKANADLFLLNKTGQVLQRSARKGKSPESTGISLEAGTYFIRIQSRDRRATQYKLSLSSVPIPPPLTPPSVPIPPPLTPPSVPIPSPSTPRSTQPPIASNRWKVDYFNNPSLQGNAVLTEDRGNGSQTLFVDWGFGAPTGVPVDGFSTRSTTNRPLAAGLYKVTTNADDGIRVTVGSGWRVIDKWIDQGNENTHSGFFRWEGGNLPIIVEHYENGSGASVKVSITPHTNFNESVPSGNWVAGVYAWNGAQSLPPADPLGSFYASPNSKIATLDLGSNNLGSTQGINMDLGPRALKGNGAALPHDNFVVRAYTAATLEQGATYNFQVRSDDGYKIFAKNQVTDQWVYITPQGQWQTDAYGGKNFSFKMNASSGLYDMHFLYQETLGDAYFDLSWAKANVANEIMSSQYFVNNWQSLPQYQEPQNPFVSSYTDSVSGIYYNGNCTWYARGRMLQLGYSPSALSTMFRNAGTWDENAGNGAFVSNTPQVGSIAVWEGGVNGAGSVGHVAVVESVNGNGTITISESNWGNSSRRYNTRTISANAPSKFIIVPRA